MRASSTLRLVAQLSLVLAILVSMALLVDSLGVTPAYCSGPTGCLAAKLEARRFLGRVPLPLLGIIAFASLLAISMWRATDARRATRVARGLELAGAVVATGSGIAFLLVQWLKLKTFCPFCVVVDVSAVVAGAALIAARRVKGEPRQSLHPAAMAVLVLVACVAPVLWPHVRPSAALPRQLEPYQVKGRVAIIEFVDLECGHCRALYPVLERIRLAQGERLQFTRLHAPLRSHRRAREAARLVECVAEDPVLKERLTEAFFESPRLDRASILSAAEFAGLAQEEANRCWADASTESALDANVQLLESLGFQGLPTTYVGAERIVGAMPPTVYTAAIERAQRSPGSTMAGQAAFYFILGLLVLGTILLGRARDRIA